MCAYAVVAAVNSTDSVKSGIANAVMDIEAVVPEIAADYIFYVNIAAFSADIDSVGLFNARFFDAGFGDIGYIFVDLKINRIEKSAFFLCVGVFDNGPLIFLEFRRFFVFCLAWSFEKSAHTVEFTVNDHKVSE